MGEIDYNSHGDYRNSNFSNINDIISYQNAHEGVTATMTAGELVAGARAGTAYLGGSYAANAASTGMAVYDAGAAATSAAQGAAIPIAGAAADAAVFGGTGINDAVADRVLGMSESEVRQMAADQGWDYDKINAERNYQQGYNSSSQFGGARASIQDALGRNTKTEEDFRATPKAETSTNEPATQPTTPSSGASNGKEEQMMKVTPLEEFCKKLRDSVDQISTDITDIKCNLNAVTATEALKGTETASLEEFENLMKSKGEQLDNYIETLIKIVTGEITSLEQLSYQDASSIDDVMKQLNASLGGTGAAVAGAVAAGAASSGGGTQGSTPKQSSTNASQTASGNSVTTNGGFKVNYDSASGTMQITAPNGSVRTENVGAGGTLTQNSETSAVVVFDNGHKYVSVDHSTASMGTMESTNDMTWANQKAQELGASPIDILTASHMGQLDAGSKLREVHFTSPEGCGFGMQVMEPGSSEWKNIGGDLPAGATLIDCSGTTPTDSNCADGNCNN